MPTPSNKSPGKDCATETMEWAAHSEGPRRSVFGNYAAPDAPSRPAEEALTQIRNPKSEIRNSQGLLTSAPTSEGGLQAAIDTAVARTFIYQFLARAFEDPLIENWDWLTNGQVRQAFQSAVQALGSPAVNLDKIAATLTARLELDSFEPFQIAYVTAFGHAARGDCPLNEIEYGDLNADPLFQPHRLADLAAFYRAFGVEVAEGASERPDHIGMELEFMSVLTAKEAYAHEHQLDQDQWTMCLEAQKTFLREHLGRWALAFARRLARAATHDVLALLAEFTRHFITAECARFGLKPGSEDLLLRPVDPATESMCDSCGLSRLPPGAAGPAKTPAVGF